MVQNIRHEFGRKTIHFSAILIPLGFRYLLNNDRKIAFLILVPLTFLSILMEILRFWHPGFRSLFFKKVGHMMRAHEKENFSGATFLLISSIVCIAFFPANITFVAIASLAIGDTLAAIIGINFGQRKLLGTKKTLEGSLACFISTFAFGIFFLHPILAFSGALATTFAEFYPKNLDDNLKIPLFSGFVMTLVNMLI